MAEQAHDDVAEGLSECASQLSINDSNMSLSSSTTEEEEHFVDIQGFPGYYISNLGRVATNKYGFTTYIKIYPSSSGYPKTTLYRDDKDYSFFVHRLVAQHFVPNPGKPFVDHINHNKADNRATNLRWCTHQENMRNKPMQKNNTSGVTGVYYDSKSQKWKPAIGVNGKMIRLGTYVNFDDAVEARKQAELKYFGEFTNQT